MAESIATTKIPRDVKTLYECAEQIWGITPDNAKDSLISLSNLIKDKIIPAEFILNTIDHVAEYKPKLVADLSNVYYNISISFKKITDIQCAALDKAVAERGLIPPNPYTKYPKHNIKKSEIVKAIINNDIDKVREMAQETVLKPSYVNLAIRRHHNEIADLLIKDYLSEFEETLLYDAIRAANLQAAVYLVEHKINNTDFRSLDAACRTGNLYLVKYLIRNGAAVNRESLNKEIH